ncbi:MAG TPA: hypothetical protein VNZ26_17680 [Vicinamibacterales bacterium]|nr:hypothetical protein [Vicinamibacterales bacterium]
MTTWDSSTFSYDLDGNLTSDGLTSYRWNARNQLIGLSGATTAAFAYDTVGRRRGKTVNGMTTQFLYDEMNLVQELGSGGTPTAKLLADFRIDETFTRTDTAGTSSLLVDAVGSTLALALGQVLQAAIERAGRCRTTSPLVVNYDARTGTA